LMAYYKLIYKRPMAGVQTAKNRYLAGVLLSNSTYTEAELVHGLASRDEQAYSFLYDRYSKALFVVILQLVNRHEVAEDVLQEVFIKIWQNIGMYDERKGRLYTWMLNIARNQAIDRLRSKDFNNQSRTVELSSNVYNASGEGARVEDVGLKKTLAQLPEDNRKLLELAYFQGYTHEEIAKMIQIPLGTVKTRIRSTVSKLRNILSFLL
jgi:RNA polymerase sigma factor (sigma-70 family)